MKRPIIFLMALVIILASMGLALTAQSSEIRGERTVISDFIDNETAFYDIPLIVEDDGTTIELDMQRQSDNLDTLLYLLDSQGRIIAENDDRPTGERDSLLVFPQAKVGNYRVIATRYGVQDGNTTGAFELVAELQSSATETSLSYDTSPEALTAAGFPEIEPRSHATWTILAYYGGDTNLEDGILADLNEFELAGGSSDEVRIVALMDRHPAYSEASGNWVGTRIYEITADVSGDEADNTPTIDSEPLAELGNLDTGDGTTFAQFLAWGLATYPADHYVIALASHGAAWRGVVTDESNLETQLSLQELSVALEQAREVAGVEKFDALINDACLMSSVEYHQVMAEYFDFSLASPEIVINPALDMTIFTDALKAGGEIDLVAIGDELVDTYIERDATEGQGTVGLYLTSAVTDLSEFGAVIEAVENFAELVNNNIAIYAPIIGEARAKAYTYTSFAGDEDLIDLGNFMNRVIAETSDPTLQVAANNVLEALGNAVLYGKGGERAAAQVSAYQNIYFPNDSRRFDGIYLTEGGLEQWGTMLRNFYSTVNPSVWTQGDERFTFHPPATVKVNIFNSFPTTAASTATGFAIGFETVGRNIAFGDITFDQIQTDGSRIRYLTDRLLENVGTADGSTELVSDWSDGVEVNTFLWDVALPVLSDGVNRGNEFFIVTEDVASVDGRYREADSDIWEDVTLAFDRTTGQLQQVISRSTETNSVGVVTIPTGSIFQTFKQVVTPDGRVTTEPGNVYIWSEGGPTWSFAPAPSGDYEIGLLITTFGGTTSFASASTTIENAGVDDSIRAAILPELGFSLTRPEDWEDLAVFQTNGVFLRSSAPDGEVSENVYFTFGEDIENDLNAIVDRIAGEYNLEVGDDRNVLALSGGKQALAFDYVNTVEGTAGRGIAAFSAGNFFNIGLVLGVESEDDDLRSEIFTLMSTNSSVFDITEFEAAGVRNWGFADDAENLPLVSFPMHQTWSVEGVADGWVQYSDGTNFVAVTSIVTDETDADAIISQLMDDTITSALDELDEQGTRTFFGQNHEWTALLYEAERENTPVAGRIYVTFANDNAYVVWAEVEINDEAATVISERIEPIIDGFVISAPTE
jgi:hypothetical protein